MSKLHYHSSIQEHLEDLANLDETVGPSELICGWFDDLYFPAEQSCPSGYPQETWDRGQREWSACFSTGELAALAAFHAVFSFRVDSLSLDPEQWRHDPGWAIVGEAAQVAVGRFRSAA